MEKNRKDIIIISLAIVAVLSILFLVLPEERTITVQVPYQEAVYKTVEKTVYVTQTETRYKNEQITKYKTLYDGTLWDDGLFTSSYTFTNAGKYDYTYTGRDLWGNSDYKFYIYNEDGSLRQTYTEINSWKITPKQWAYTETIQVPYEVQVTVPKVVTEQVIDRYETRYKTEYRTITKMRIEWLLQ